MFWAEVILWVVEGVGEIFFCRTPTCPHCHVETQQKSKRHNKRLYRCPCCEREWLKSGKTWEALPGRAQSEVFRDERV
jgi:Zn-finger nucleic acid-binding protein